MNKIIKTYKFKLKPNKEQEGILFHYLNTTRFIYNLCLNYKKDLYSSYGISISKNNIQKELKEVKNETEWMKNIHSQVIQEVTDRLFISYDNFFRGVKNGENIGYPKFVKRNFWSSFKFKQGVGICENTNKVKLPKIGKIKFRKSCSIYGTIKNAIVKREYDGWYISIYCEMINENTESFNHDENKSIGIDLGIKDLMITSDGEVIENKKTLRKWQDKLAKTQRKLSRKEKGSNNRNKIKNELKKIYSKITRIRKDYIHKITTKIVNENQVIICEKLNTKGLMKRCKTKTDENGNYLHNGQSRKSGLNKSIQDASWSAIVNMLEYKSKWNGKIFHLVAPQYTSQDCSNCGWRNSNLVLSDREWTCEVCHTHHDRDINASVNILNKGINELKEVGHTFYTFGDMDGITCPAEELHKIVKQTV